jgi:hypothetical protein
VRGPYVDTYSRRPEHRSPEIRKSWKRSYRRREKPIKRRRSKSSEPAKAAVAESKTHIVRREKPWKPAERRIGPLRILAGPELSLTQLPTNNDLFSAWAGSCEGVCDTDGGAPAGDWVCPGSIEFPNDGGVGCIVESAGTCRDNNFYGFECDTTMSPSTTCTCKTNGVENGKVVQSNCRDGWVACEFPKYQGQ